MNVFVGLNSIGFDAPDLVTAFVLSLILVLLVVTTLVLEADNENSSEGWDDDPYL